MCLGCGGEGGTGPTLVWYLCGVEAATTEAWDVAAASAGPTAGLPLVAAGAEAARENTTAAAVVVVEGGVAAAVATVVGGGAAVATGLRLERSCSPRV